MDRTRLLGLLLATILVAGCGSSPVQGTGGPCESSGDGIAAEIAAEVASLCTKAIELANARLGWLHWPITSTHFRLSTCPPNARCAMVPRDRGWVIFTFAIGDPVMIHVGPPEAGSGVVAELIAGEPEPLPDWLLADMAAQTR